MDVTPEINDFEIRCLEEALKKWHSNEPTLQHIKVDFRKRLLEIFGNTKLADKTPIKLEALSKQQADRKKIVIPVTFSISSMSTLSKRYNNKNVGDQFEKLCSFCKNSHEPEQTYKSHTVAHCPILRHYICTVCGEKGHTLSHCNVRRMKNTVCKLIKEYNDYETK